MIKLGAVSTNTRGIPLPNFVEDLIFWLCGQFYPQQCGRTGAQACF